MGKTADLNLDFRRQLSSFLAQKLTNKIEILSKFMYLLAILKTESDKLVIEVEETSLTETTGLSIFNQGG